MNVNVYNRDRDRFLCDYCTGFYAEHHRPPKYREITDAIGAGGRYYAPSPAVIRDRLMYLVRSNSLDFEHTPLRFLHEVSVTRRKV